MASDLKDRHLKLMEDSDNESYVLEHTAIPDYDEDDFLCEEIQVDDDFSVSEESEDFENALKALKEDDVDKYLQQTKPVLQKSSEPSVTLRPELTDDFVRNFLVKMEMKNTLECFQTEWYELCERGLLSKEVVENVPDIYARQQKLEDLVKSLHKEIKRYKDAADHTRQSCVRLRKERDFHRMHHKRVVQEKDKLIDDLRRLKKHYDSYEPALKSLKQKYEVALREKMLTKLERDRAIGQIVGLQATLSNSLDEKIGKNDAIKDTHPVLEMQCEKKMNDIPSENKPMIHPKDSMFPHDVDVNPLLNYFKHPSPHLTRAGGFRLTNTIDAHDMAVSAIALHPRKQVLATCSDDKTWKMWAVPSGNMIMTGEGHKDWIADCDFSPGGGSLATVSGDSTVKIWDFNKAECVLTFTEHIHAVWGCSWHSAGDFLATCSMDCTGKIWDINSERCRSTLRGHADSVNSITFLPYSNYLLTSSADKTLSMWDARTGLCGQSFFGHMHSVNHGVFNLRGDIVASCDSYGVIKLWDVRSLICLASVDFGPHPTNRVSFDPSSSVLAVASNDGSIRMYEISSGKHSQLTGHEEAVQTVLFDKTGEFLLSASSDGTLRVWS
ncbi:sperm-associated antigen 16 protein-like isoform X2 [Xenia sp. Carnegie-2017]|uniref:sperm-associated antigen 16 protein-like isoform X2 n=1 Tax=Xenia sp. Carnegie-2017 TaxID=2897299 RepID=UPI001F042C2C|nr:sperm-associated antigen 16 protein-like isoform X2 [Xenia sp. Carnegie-2017]